MLYNLGFSLGLWFTQLLLLLFSVLDNRKVVCPRRSSLSILGVSTATWVSQLCRFCPTQLASYAQLLQTVQLSSPQKSPSMLFLLYGRSSQPRLCTRIIRLLRNTDAQDLPIYILWIRISGMGLGMSNFESFPGDSSVQAVLRTTPLDLCWSSWWRVLCAPARLLPTRCCLSLRQQMQMVLSCDLKDTLDHSHDSSLWLFVIMRTLGSIGQNTQSIVGF